MSGSPASRRSSSSFEERRECTPVVPLGLWKTKPLFSHAGATILSSGWRFRPGQQCRRFRPAPAAYGRVAQNYISIADLSHLFLFTKERHPKGPLIVLEF